MDVEWSSEAFDALADIYRYGLLVWFEKIADKYQERFKTVVELIAQHPEIGKSRDGIGSGIRSFPVEEHMIFYRVTSATVVILAIFHASADVSSIQMPPGDE